MTYPCLFRGYRFVTLGGGNIFILAGNQVSSYFLAAPRNPPVHRSRVLGSNLYVLFMCVVFLYAVVLSVIQLAPGGNPQRQARAYG